MSFKNKKSPIIVALDFSSLKEAESLVAQLNPDKCRLKVGKEMFTRFGPKFVESLISDGFDVFLDLKFHDIPQTVYKACRAAAELGVWMLNVHALGGLKMLEAAREAIDSCDGKKPLLIAVTMLTSLDEQDIPSIGLSGSISDNVTRLALLAKDAGIDGIVCSAKEAKKLRSLCGDDFCLVTPGIRLSNIPGDDQKRIVTPLDAIRFGADFLVIGRAITQAKDPAGMLETIEASLI